MSKKVKNDVKGSNFAEKRPHLMKNKKNNIFWILSGKYGKMSKKVTNDEKGSQIAEKGQNWWKNKKNNMFWIFSG